MEGLTGASLFFMESVKPRNTGESSALWCHEVLTLTRKPQTLALTLTPIWEVLVVWEGRNLMEAHSLCDNLGGRSPTAEEMEAGGEEAPAPIPVHHKAWEFPTTCTAAALSVDKKWLATTHTDGGTIIWDVRSGPNPNHSNTDPYPYPYPYPYP